MINQQRNLHYEFLHSNFYTTVGRITEVGDRYRQIVYHCHWIQRLGTILALCTSCYSFTPGYSNEISKNVCSTYSGSRAHNTTPTSRYLHILDLQQYWQMITNNNECLFGYDVVM